MFKQIILGVGNNSLVSRTIQQYGMQMGAARFVAGSTLGQAIAAVKELNERGIAATLDHLGESVTRIEEAQAARNSYLAMLDAIAKEQVRSHVSLKLTMMGLAISEEACLGNLLEILDRAHQYGNFVRIDMEDSHFTAATLNMFQKAWDKYPENVGVVLQAYLYRTMEDLNSLSQPPKNFRIVKGAYQEPASLAYPSKPDVDDNYVALVQASLQHGNFTAVASHDEVVLGKVVRFLESQHIPQSQVEFQMLYGVKLSVLEDLARRGFAARVYVPWGRDWYAYYLRRIAERPANLLFFARSLAKR